MADIYLVRHGETEDNVEGILNGHRYRPLTDVGRRQEINVGWKLKNKRIQIIYSSPLIRAHEIATIISKQLNLPDEQVLRTQGVNYFLQAEGAEDFPALYDRAPKPLAHVQQVHPNEHVLLVAHGDIGKMIRAAYHGWDWKTGLLTPYFEKLEY